MVEADTSEVPPEDTEADPADLERQRLRRQKSRKLLYIFGWTQVVEGAVACVLGIATIVFSSPTLTFTFLMGTQMWCGIILLSAGFLGVRASKYQDLPDGRINRREKSIIMMYYSWTIIAFLPAVLILLYAGVAVALCNRDAPADTATACFALDNIQTGLGLTNVTVGTVLSLTIIPFLAFIGVFCKSYAAKSKARRARTSVTSAGGTVLEDAVRRQSHIIRQQQEQIQLLSQRQQAMEQRIRASHVPLEAPPPYRQDAPPGVEFPKSPPGVEFPKTPPPYKHIQQSDQTVAAS